MMIIHESIELLFRLLMAHMLVDFVLQGERMLREKRKWGAGSGWLAFHALLAGVLAYVISGYWEAWLWVGGITAVTHWMIDWVKIRTGDSMRSFLLDQAAHLVVIVLIVWWVVGLEDIMQHAPGPGQIQAVFVLITGVLILLQPSSIVIQKIFERWTGLFEDYGDHLPNAGKWIGYLERILIVLFILIGEYSAIGFLIAAKSILRFRDPQSRQKMTEYILLGTLLSFTAAIVIGVSLKALLGW